MRKTGFGLVKTTVVILIAVCVNNTLADSIFDHFDDGILGPEWYITFDNALGWTYNESGTHLTVTNIDINQPSIKWSHVFVSQEFIAPVDFTAECSIAWDSGGSNSAMQNIFILLKGGGETIVSAGYHDAWVTRRGEKAAAIGGALFNSGMNTLPLSGSVNIKIERIADEVSILWDDVLILSSVENRAIDEITLRFSTNTYPTSTFGNLSADFVLANSEIPSLSGIEIIGPNEVTEESSVQYSAIAVYDNNSTKDVTDQAYWAVMPDNHADINDSGLLTTEQLVMPTEDVTIYAEYEEGNDIAQAEKDVTVYSICPSRSALDFDGNDDYVVIADNPTLTPTKITLSAWINPDDVSHHFQIIGKWAHLKGADYIFDNRGNYDALRLAIDSSEDYCQAFSNDAVLSAGTWQHVAVTYDGSISTFYVNGVNAGQDNSCSVELPDTYHDVYIGYSYSDHSVGGHRPFDGLIGNVCIYDKALTQEEIQHVMVNGPDSADSNLVAYWDFDEGEGQVAHDSSGNGNDGYLGSDPCEADDCDPCWVEPGAPLNCTPRQMIVRNLDGALERKRIAQQQINEALERERASVRLLMRDMQGRRNFGQYPWNIMHSAIEIHKSMQMENLCMKKLNESAEALRRALDWLHNNTVPAWPGKGCGPKHDNPGNGPKNN